MHQLKRCLSTVNVPSVPNFINGEFVQSQATKHFKLHNPANQKLLFNVPQSTPQELSRATEVAAAAFKEWRKSSILTRQQVMLKLQALIRQNMDSIAASITLEQGKTLGDARGDVLRGLQVVEFAASIPSMLMGDLIEVSQDMDTFTMKEPLGVVGGT
jgi:malonate-semialdehyde dehydrogenase (acetylating)/methylmalonate-semialdehyde dehydrogenase